MPLDKATHNIEFTPEKGRQLVGAASAVHCAHKQLPIPSQHPEFPNDVKRATSDHRTLASTTR